MDWWQITLICSIGGFAIWLACFCYCVWIEGQLHAGRPTYNNSREDVLSDWGFCLLGPLSAIAYTIIAVAEGVWDLPSFPGIRVLHRIWYAGYDRANQQYKD